MKTSYFFVLLSLCISSNSLYSFTNSDDSLIDLAANRESYDYIPDVPYETMKKHVAELENEMPLHFNVIVGDFINFFAVKEREYTRKIIKRSSQYFPIIEASLEKHNLPDELKYLAIVESALNPANESPMGAAGLWQLMKPTARQYGLVCNRYVDERMDPYKSTEAAIKLLKWLYNSFGDWELALAAYNTGYGNVKQAIRRAGSKSFWAIYKYLPRETRSFLPQFVAFTYLMNNQEAHNFYVPVNRRVNTKKITVRDHMDLKKLARGTNYCYEDLKKLNSHLQTSYVPQNAEGIKVVIPADLFDHVIHHYAAYIEPDKPAHENWTASEKVYHVQAGDSLWEISRKFDEVSIAELKELNNLKGNTIRPGQQLRLAE